MKKEQLNPTTQIVREAMRIVSKDVIAPKVVREGLVKTNKTNMKTQEEIEQLAETAFQDELIKSNQNINWIGYGKGIDGTSKERWIELWIKGYTKCQEDVVDKKYTEEDMLKCWNAACVNSFGFDEESYELNAYSDFINSLKKQD